MSMAADDPIPPKGFPGLRPLPQSRRAAVALLRPVSVAKVGRHPGKKES